ncbi:MAG TPA: acetyl-CoA carboxylase biotin carboxyl carrier protein [Coxiellaceae bacterium]|nr:acetyl-CoA carboxylase biotin carboxyl carrier protein [Coxiellaceae bacterium]
MDIRTIKKLIELINETGVGEIEVTSKEGDAVRISRHMGTTPLYMPTPPPAVVAALPMNEKAQPGKTEHSPKKEVPEGHTVKSPMVGTVYLASKPGAKPFVEVGQRVSAGDTLCIIEAMKMFNEIEADVSGVLSARLIENQHPVEFDQPLFVIDTDA